jgi:elongation factor Ts
LDISIDLVKELKEQSGAGFMSCRKALLETNGDMEEARELLRQRGLLIAQEKAERAATDGVIEAYIHTGGRIGALVEVNCETDFVARTAEFQELAHNMAMQVAAMQPQFLSEEEITDGSDVEPQTACLLSQPYIKDLSRTVQDVINETIARVRENIRIRRFARFELGEQD